MKIIFSLFLFFSLLCFGQANAQWRIHNDVHAPFGKGYSISKIAYDDAHQNLWVFAYKYTEGHFVWEYSESNGWVTQPIPPFSESENLVTVKFRDGIGWCLTTANLYKYENDNWNLVSLPPGYTLPQTIDGLYVGDQNTWVENVWFVGGSNGKGITKYDGMSWTNYNTSNTPDFKQDVGISSISMDEENDVLWIATNCFGNFSGVYSYDLKNDDWQLYDNIDPKYGCVHGVVPIKSGAIVGTCNFSSIRVLEDGIFTQSIDGARAGCVAKMETDPDNENWAWVLTDWKLFHFSDTLHFEMFDTTNSLLKGEFLISMATQENYHDSSRVWVITPTGLYSYTYASSKTETGVNDLASIFDDVQVYPNPSKGMFTIGSQNLRNTVIEIRDSYGKLVHHNHITRNESYSVDLSGLPAGLYFLTISNGTSKVFRKLILTE